MTRRIAPRAGFTLVELLLAVALLSLIVSALLGGLHIGQRAFETGKDYEAVGEAEEATQAVADLFARAFPIATPRKDGLPVAAFDGETTRCRFIASSDGGSLWGGLALVEIGLDDAGALTIWTRVYRPDEDFDAPRAAMRATQALRGVTQFDLSYFGVVERQRPPVWTKAWSALQETPKLVTLQVGLRRGGKDIVVSAAAALRQR
jgi:general secretion pathway protein J